MVDLLCELNAYYSSAAAPREVVRSHLHDRLLAADSPLRLVVAVADDNSVTGFAAIYLVHSLVDPHPEKSSQCALKELFVSQAARGQGIGKALMAWVARHALDNGCCRVDWPVNAANHCGIGFYETLGASRQAERLSYRLAGEHLTRLAGALPPPAWSAA
jgi:GNAT superfamily N-acetyltransferase